MIKLLKSLLGIKSPSKIYMEEGKKQRIMLGLILCNLFYKLKIAEKEINGRE